MTAGRVHARIRVRGRRTANGRSDRRGRYRRAIDLQCGWSTPSSLDTVQTIVTLLAEVVAVAFTLVITGVDAVTVTEPSPGAVSRLIESVSLIRASIAAGVRHFGAAVHHSGAAVTDRRGCARCRDARGHRRTADRQCSWTDTVDVSHLPGMVGLWEIVGWWNCRCQSRDHGQRAVTVATWADVATPLTTTVAVSTPNLGGDTNRMTSCVDVADTTVAVPEDRVTWLCEAIESKPTPSMVSVSDMKGKSARLTVTLGNAVATPVDALANAVDSDLGGQRSRGRGLRQANDDLPGGRARDDSRPTGQHDAVVCIGRVEARAVNRQGRRGGGPVGRAGGDNGLDHRGGHLRAGARHAVDGDGRRDRAGRQRWTAGSKVTTSSVDEFTVTDVTVPEESVTTCEAPLLGVEAGSLDRQRGGGGQHIAGGGDDRRHRCW